MALIKTETESLLMRVLDPTTGPARPVAANMNRQPTTRQAPRSLATTWTLPGITVATRVTTNYGHVPAHLVRAGDMLKTRCGTYLRVLRISEYKLDQEFLERRPDAAPVVIRKGSLRPHLPLQDVSVSPAQMMSLTFGRDDQDMKPAIEVTQLRPEIDQSLGMVAYYQFHLGEAAQICCDGVWVEAAV